MIHLCLDLFYEMYNIINQHYQKQIYFLSLLFLDFLDIFEKRFKSSSMISSVSFPIKISVITIMYLVLSRTYYLVRILSESLEEKKLIAIVN